jgi:hypothetical protein
LYQQRSSSSLYWGEYAIIYQQGQYLRTARIDRRGRKPAIVKGSCRTVYETLGFFQCTFVKAITDWNIGSQAERDMIFENNIHRNTFSKLTERHGLRGDFALRFVDDSPLEGARFELSVPRPRFAGYRSKAAKTVLSPFI